MQISQQHKTTTGAQVLAQRWCRFAKPAPPVQIENWILLFDSFVQTLLSSSICGSVQGTSRTCNQDESSPSEPQNGIL